MRKWKSKEVDEGKGEERRRTDRKRMGKEDNVTRGKKRGRKIRNNGKGKEGE